MKIAIIRSSSSVLEPKSYNIQETGLAKSLLKTGISTDIYMAGAGREPKIEEVKQSGEARVRLFLFPFYGLPGRQAIFPSLLTYLSRTEYDLIQVHEDSQVTSVAVSVWADKKDIPVVLCQGMYSNYRGGSGIIQTCYDVIALPWLRKRVMASIAKTSAAKKYLIEKGFDPVYVCPVGLDPEGLEIADDPNGKDGREGDGSSRLINIVYVGSLERRRNTFFMLELFAELARSRNDVRFLVAGDGPDREEFMKRITAKGLTHNVHYLGRLDQRAVAYLYRHADALILPSNYEIYGMVILEAMYFGVPVFSTSTAGAVDIIESGQNGFIVGSLNAVEWKERIESYLGDMDRKKIRQNARDTVRKRFLWDIAYHAYHEVYQRVTGKLHA